MPSEVRILPSPSGPPAVDRLDPSIFINPVVIDSSGVSEANCSFLPLSVGNLRKRNPLLDLSEVRKRFNECVFCINNAFFLSKGGSSSVGRASAFQAEGRGFDPRFPLHYVKIILLINFAIYLASLSFSIGRFFSLPRTPKGPVLPQPHSMKRGGQNREAGVQKGSYL
jgi:hypothetical protein